MGPRRMAAQALDVDPQLVGGRQHGTGPDGELADRQAGEIVHPIDLFDPETVHQPVIDHFAAAAAALLGRLEDQHGGAGEIAGLGQIARGPSSMAVWPSWPQACMVPGTVDLYGRSTASSIGSASMSARRPMAGPDPCGRG